MNNINKPIASLSLDLDNLWSYLKVHGDPNWQSFPSILDLVVPRILDFLDRHNLKITFFIVGQDAALEKNRDSLNAIASAGHEIGNHSFHHNSWLHLFSEEEIKQEIILAEKHIESVTGQHPLGFRAPGYSFSPDVLRVLLKRGYQYDASTFPTFLGPLARTYYLMTTKLSPEERAQRQNLFGKFKDGFQRLKPYQWEMGQLLEIPVTTLPIFKFPIHFTYILYMSSLAKVLGISYFQFALKLCRINKIEPSLVLHPTDFLDNKDVPALSFFPGMKLPFNRKLAILNQALQLLSKNFTILNVGGHAKQLINQSLPILLA